MASNKPPKQKDAIVEILETYLIVELARCGVPQPGIRKIVGCDMWRVSEIARFFKKKKTRDAEKS